LADLHVHTVADANHRYQSANTGKEPNAAFAAELMESFASARVSVIAVTDHNRVDWWPILRDAGKRHGIAVFPGIEISVNRCHLIGIWEANANGHSLAQRFTTAIHRPGETPYLNGSPRPVTVGNVEENARKIVEHGGLVVAPHSTSRQLGLFGPGVCSNADAVAQSGLISAFDVYGNPGSDVLQNPKSKFGDALPRWIITGDTRSFDDVGERALYLKLGAQPTLEGLRQAFLSPVTRIRFREASRTDWGRVRGVAFAADREPRWPRITALTVKGGFHDGLDVQFAPGLNALIGGKGTGKSAVIELIRHVTGAPQPADKSLLDNRVRNFPANADAEVGYVDIDGAEYSIKRSGGTSAPQLFINGVKSDVEASRRVALNIFGQRQLAELASSAALREFLARSVGDRWTSLVEDQRLIVRDLQSNGSAISARETALADLEDKASERSDFAERVDRARAAGADKVIVRLRAVSTENQSFRRVQQWPKSMADSLSKAREVLPVPTPPARPPAMQQLARRLAEAGSVVSEALERADEAVGAVASSLEAAQEAWVAYFERQKAALEGDLADAGVTNPPDLAAWQTRLSELDDELSALPETRTRHADLAKQRDELLTRLRAGWRARSRLIEEAAQRVAGLLPPRVRLVTTPLGDRSGFRAALERSVQGQGVRSDQLDKLAGLDPATVLKATEAGVDALVALGVTANTAAKFAGLAPDARRSLELAEIQDHIRIEMDPSPAGTGDWRDVGDVSPGQRATALLALVLVGGKEPLIIDQPEDDLDNRYIYEEVVGVLTRVCEERQVIVATHNANIPVLGDAEFLIALDASATRRRRTLRILRERSLKAAKKRSWLGRSVTR